MKITVSSDEYSVLVDCVLEEIRTRGHAAEYYGPRAGEESGEEADWPVVTLKAVLEVAEKRAAEAIVMCWTGTGASLAANKVPGIRAALCHDAETAKGARIWNHANVLALSLRTTSLPIAKEILNVWFSTPFSDDGWNLKQIERIKAIETQFQE